MFNNENEVADQYTQFSIIFTIFINGTSDKTIKQNTIVVNRYSPPALKYS